VKRLSLLFLAGLLVFLTSAGCTKVEEKKITAFCGSASKPAMEEVVRAFMEETGIKVYLNFSGSGTMLSQMKLSRSGDLYIPGSPDYMVMAEHEGVVEPESVVIISYLVPTILVQHGNPKDIQELSDLAKPGIKIGIGNPEAVCVGLYAIEILEYNSLLAEVVLNIVTHAESCSRTASLIALKSVDAIIGWRVFSEWNPDTTSVVYLKPEQIPRLAYIPAAISTFTKNRDSAQRFLDFLVSPQGQEIFSKWGYIATQSEARKFAPDVEIGGEYKLSETYKSLVK
jgi:molybdate transport system substrate-binding protein